MQAIGGDVQISAATAGDETSQPSFEMVAYSGGAMKPRGFNHPLVVDLDGLDVTAKSRPVFKDHQSTQIVGHTTSIEKVDGQLIAKGLVSGDESVTAGVLSTAKKGFPWQASIGAQALKMTFIDKNKSVKVNGRVHSGPIYHVERSRLAEISFVALGADDNTTTTVAAEVALEDTRMGFEAWVEAQGFSLADLSEGQVKVLRAAFDAENGVKAEKEAKTGETAVKAESPTVDLIAEAVEQSKYIASIQDAADGRQDIVAKALENKWSVETTKLAAENAKLKEDRPQGELNPFAIHSKSQDNSDDVLIAALALECGVSPDELKDPLHGLDAKDRRFLQSSSERPMSEKTIEAADTQYRNITLCDVLNVVARRDARFTGRPSDVTGLIQASFTSLSLPTVFQQALNRTLLAQYKMSSFKWRNVAKTSSVPDFRTVDRFRIHGTGHWEKLTDAGELKHGQIEEGDKYSINIDTLGEMLMLTRKDFINDDLGALTNIASMMTFYGTLAPELEVFKAISDNTGSFFHANNSNLVTGAANAFGLDGLTELWKKFRNQRDRGVSKDAAKAKPGIDVTPRILLVPHELELPAMTLLGQSRLGIGGAENTNGLITTDNPFYNKFQIISSIYLSDTAVSASASATAYYLLADPAMLPAIEVAFLRGRQRPTIETVEPRPEVLGMGFRGWFDFGVKLMDPKAAAKCTGTT